MDGYNPQKVFSSIDRMGRYAFANQPSMAAWNLAQLATSLLPLMQAPRRRRSSRNRRVNGFVETFQTRWRINFGRKIGIGQATEADLPLIEGLLARMGSGHVDFTRVFAGLSEARQRRNSPRPMPGRAGRRIGRHAWPARKIRSK